MTSLWHYIAGATVAYLVYGALLVLVLQAPGSLLDADTGAERRLSRAVWIVVWLAWPYFYARWAINTLRG